MAKKSTNMEPVGAVFYTKEQLLTSGRYKNQKDLVQALLTKSKTYSLAQADEAIEKFMKGKVK